MKKMMILAIAFACNAWAQTPPTDPVVSAPESEPTAAIAKPTSAQKKTVKEVAKKAKKSAKESGQDPAAQEAALETEAQQQPPQPTAVPEEPKTTQAPTEPKKETKKTEKSASDTKESHQYGMHVDFNIPHILNYGVDFVHSTRWFSGSINLGSYGVKGIAKNTDLPNGVDVSLSNQELVARVHPFRGSFYAGLGYGQHKFDVTGTRTITVTVPAGSADVEINDVVQAKYLLPHIGWMSKWPFGLTMGFDIGYLSPMSPTVDLTTRVSNISGPISQSDVENTQEYRDARAELVSQSEKLGKTGLPYWTVFRIGFLF